MLLSGGIIVDIGEARTVVKKYSQMVLDPHKPE
jgi:hypothetical protein